MRILGSTLKSLKSASFQQPKGPQDREKRVPGSGEDDWRRGNKLTEGGGERRTARVQHDLGGTEGNVRTCGPVRSEGEDYGWGDLEKCMCGFVCGARGFEGKVSRQKVWYGGLGVGGGQLERIGRVEGEGRVGVEFKKQS